MSEVLFSFSVIAASAILAAAIVYGARTIAAAIDRQAPNDRADRGLRSSQHSPLSPAGYPVEPSGVPVELETSLAVGTNVLAFWQGRWWHAEVMALEDEERVRIHYTGWDPSWDESVPRSALQLDLGTIAQDELP